MHALSGLGRLGDYLESRGERGYPAEPRARAEFALRVFLSRVFEDSTDFELHPERLERAYGEVESALYDGRYAVTGPLVAVGGRQSLTSWCMRRLRRLDGADPERAWLQNVVGALAADVPE